VDRVLSLQVVVGLVDHVVELGLARSSSGTQKRSSGLPDLLDPGTPRAGRGGLRQYPSSARPPPAASAAPQRPTQAYSHRSRATLRRYQNTVSSPAPTRAPRTAPSQRHRCAASSGGRPQAPRLVRAPTRSSAPWLGAGSPAGAPRRHGRSPRPSAGVAGFSVSDGGASFAHVAVATVVTAMTTAAPTRPRRSGFISLGARWWTQFN